MTERPRCSVVGCGNVCRVHQWHRNGIVYAAICETHYKVLRAEINAAEERASEFAPFVPPSPAAP